MKRWLGESRRNWLLAGAGFGLYAAASIPWGWSLEPGSVAGFWWSLGMVCFGCAVPAVVDTLAGLRKARDPRLERRTLT